MAWSKKTHDNPNKMLIEKKCPSCGHDKAVEQFTLNHFRCTRCLHTWRD